MSEVKDSNVAALLVSVGICIAGVLAHGWYGEIDLRLRKSNLEEWYQLEARQQEKKQTQRLPPYHVILENDEHHTFEFVVESLQKALGYSQERSYQLTMQAHTAGRAVVWTGPKEVAELKADQIRSFHEIRAPAANLGPLSCYIEPAPGE